MKHTENELIELKKKHMEMWNLVQAQVEKAFEALRTGNKELAREIVARERVVNAQELIVDHHCENFIALFAPVAIDLRFVLALLKITNNLERIADFAEGIAIYLLYKQPKPIPSALYEKLKMDEMMVTCQEMLSKVREALVNESSADCGKILSMDSVMDEINNASVGLFAHHLEEHPEDALDCLHLYAVIRRLERLSDRVSNIAEDIVFFIDAKELRHQKTKDFKE